MEGKGRVDTIEKKLYDASLGGTVESLHELMQEDELSLARVSVTCFNETPLHVAAMLGHLDFAVALLDYKADLFVTRLDSEGRSPLHLASANGYIEIVRLLLRANPEVCLICDEEKRTPLHLAIMNGQIDVVKELVKVKPEAAKYTLDQGETILHLCVIYNRLEALRFLMDSCIVEDNFVTITDDVGDTILHVATALKRMQTIKYLVSRNEVGVNAINGNGFTALDTLQHMPKDVKTMEIRELLMSAGALRAKDVTKAPSVTTGPVTRVKVDIGDQISPRTTVESPPPSTYKNIKKFLKKKFSVFRKPKQPMDERKGDALMVAASVIAAMTYQSVLSPPGGVVGQEAGSSGGTAKEEGSIEAGTSNLAYADEFTNNVFWLFNTISFISSLVIIFLFTSGLSIKRKILIFLLRAAMWATITSMALAYLISLQAITPLSVEDNAVYFITGIALYIWQGLIGVSFLVLIYNLILWIVRKYKKKRALSNADEDVFQGKNNIV